MVPHEIREEWVGSNTRKFYLVTLMNQLPGILKNHSTFPPKLPGKNIFPDPKLLKKSDIFLKSTSWKCYWKGGLFVRYVSRVNWNSHPEVNGGRCSPLVVQDMNAGGGGASSSCYSAGDEWKMYEFQSFAAGRMSQVHRSHPGCWGYSWSGGAGGIKCVVMPHLTARVARVWWKLKKWEVAEANQKKCNWTVTHCFG